MFVRDTNIKYSLMTGVMEREREREREREKERESKFSKIIGSPWKQGKVRLVVDKEKCVSTMTSWFVFKLQPIVAIRAVFYHPSWLKHALLATKANLGSRVEVGWKKTDLYKGFQIKRKTRLSTRISEYWGRWNGVYVHAFRSRLNVQCS